mmetsp:Transcript_108929/g.274119  ORF Transcript_108929/g.274119 Transcript_108929/m.274119 type:complete len:783 (+) Transcript_108929:114-2462(+)
MRKQQMMQQQQLQHRQLEENRKRLEEQNRQRMEQQRVRMEEVKRQQDELRRKQDEERKRQEQELVRRRDEQTAALSIRRVVQKLRGVSPETLEEVQKEVMEVLQTQLPACGSQSDAMKQEADSGLQQAKQRVAQIQESIRKAAEAKAEAERKRQEAIAKAQELLKQLEGLIHEAEQASKALVQEAEPLSDKEAADLKLEEIQATAKAVEEAAFAAKAKAKACTDMILQKGAEMRAADPPTPGQPAEAPSEDKLTLTKLLGRINEAAKTTDSTLRDAKVAEEKAVKKAEAKKKLEATGKFFAKYDANNDGILERKDVEKYALKEFGFNIPASYFEGNFKLLVGNAKGVRKEDFQKLKVSVGILREQAKDGKRKEARVAREKELEKLRAEFQGKIMEATKEVEIAEVKVAKAETDSIPLLSKAKDMSSREMIKVADEVDELIKQAREDAACVKKNVSEVTEGCEAELKVWLVGEQKKLEFKMTRFDLRLAKSTTLCAKFREEAKKKEVEELDMFEKKAVQMLKYHQRTKDITNEDLFAALDADNNGKISQSEWLSFFKNCEKEPKGEKLDCGDAEEAATEAVAAAAATAEPSEDDLARVFASLDEDEEGWMSKERFASLVRAYMKVAKDTVITSGASIKDSKTLRRLDAGEIVEILRGPVQEGTVKVMRVNAKVMKDDLEGWITVSGNQGTTFLEDGGNVFKVVTETILTECFELDGTTSAGATKKVKDMTRKLKVGEIVEVREWAKKEEKSGLMRMKCKCRSDGATGWVTTVGNQGTVFLEVV